MNLMDMPDRAKRDMKILDVNALLETARQRTGLTDFGPDDFREGLGVVVEGINTEANIAEERWDHMVEQRFLRPLMNRLWFARDLHEHPEILDEQLGSPIIIGSLPRTGSTKLHRMLGASGSFQTLFFWSANMFARIPGLPDGGKARRIQETRDYEKWMYQTSPAILTGHPMFTDEPEEDQWLVEATFTHPLLFGMFNSLKYAQWIAQADMRPTFDYFIKQLKYLQWQSGGANGKPWLIKTPNHMGIEGLLTQLFDQPRFIFTHRDPVKCVPSVTSTALAMRNLYTHEDSSAQLGAGVLGMYTHCANEHLRWRDSEPGVDILDLAFGDITAHGIDTAHRVFDFLGMPFTAQAEQGVRDWEVRNPKDKHGKATYSAAAIGSTDEKIRAAFAPYRERFAAYL